MPICQYCGGEFHYFLFKCKWCDMLYCLKHRLPENHKCIFMPSRKERKGINSRKLYQKGTDQLSEVLTPEEIYIGAKNKIINKSDAIEFLIAMIELNNDVQIRVEAIEVLNKLSLKNKRVFKILESILVSDQNNEVKKAAIKVILKLFPKDGVNLIEWVIDNEKSDSVLKTLNDTLKATDNQYLDSLKKKIFDNDN